MKRKIPGLIFSLLAALPISVKAENVLVSGSNPQTADKVKKPAESADGTRQKQAKYDDKLELSMGYGFNFRESNAELQNHYFPFSARYKLSNNIKFSANGSVNLARRKETDENGNISRSGFEDVSIGPQIDLNYKRLRLSLSGEFTNTNPLVFEATNKKVSSASAELDIRFALKKDLALMAGISGLTAEDEVDAAMFRFYGGINKNLNKTTGVYTAVVHERDSNIYNNQITYGVLGFSEKTDSSALNLQGYGGQKLGGKLEVENRLRPDISLRLGLEGSFVNDVAKVKEFDAYLSLVFR